MPSVEAPELTLPTYCSVPPRLSSSGQEAVDLAASAGLILDPWQGWALDQSLGERADGNWSAFEVAVIVSRQNGKGSIIEARELAGLFLLDEGLIVHTAHEFKTAAEAFRRIRLLIDSTPHLRRRCRPHRMASGEEGIELHSGQRLKFLARSTGSGRGFSGDCVILDEAYALKAEEMEALLPTLSARPNPQLWYTSSAGMSSSNHLRAVRDRGREGGDPSLCYLEWCAGADRSIDPDDRAGWHRANPGMGIRITEEFVEREQRALSAEGFLRERLGIWDDAVGEQPISPAIWAQTTSDVRPTGSPHFFIDVAPGMQSASIAVAAMNSGAPHLELADYRQGTDWLVDRATELHRSHPTAAFGCDATNATTILAPKLIAAGIELELLTGPEMGRACGHLQTLAQDGAKSLTPDPPELPTVTFTHSDETLLMVALAGAVKRDIGEGMWGWARRKTTVDISPLVAMTGAAWLLEKHRDDDYDLLDSFG